MWQKCALNIGHSPRHTFAQYKHLTYISNIWQFYSRVLKFVYPYKELQYPLFEHNILCFLCQRIPRLAFLPFLHHTWSAVLILPQH